jgi:putative nucleotidyltransferase with HDIG domain
VVGERQTYLENLRKGMEDTIQAVASVVEMRDPYVAGHQRRVAQLAVAIAQELGMSREGVEGVHFGSLVHDIGKIYVPAEFLSRPGRLSDLEYKVITSHVEVGFNILKDIDFPWPVAQMIRQHHERLDGTGYPLGLKADQIVKEARIIAVADAVEAMVSHRPYRPARGTEVALQEICRDRGTWYDPEVVDACLRLFGEKRFAFAEPGTAQPAALGLEVHRGPRHADGDTA